WGPGLHRRLVVGAGARVAHVAGTGARGAARGRQERSRPHPAAFHLGPRRRTPGRRVRRGAGIAPAAQGVGRAACRGGCGGARRIRRAATESLLTESHSTMRTNDDYRPRRATIAERHPWPILIAGVVIGVIAVALALRLQLRT